MSNTLSVPAPITVGSVTIHQQNGLYSLNDLHKASGGDTQHKPAHFLANEQTKVLMVSLEKVGMSTFKTTKGRYGRTYACAELAAAYAAWISPAFHMQVLRVFLAHVGQTVQPSVPTRTLVFTIPQGEHYSARWLLDIDHAGKERCQRLSPDTHVLTRDRLVRLLIRNPADLHMALEERLSILGAMLRDLSQTACLSAQRLGIKPAKPPELISGHVASIG